MTTSSAFYNELLPEVYEIINNFGTEYTVTGRGTYNEDEMTASGGSTRVVKGLVDTGEYRNAFNAETTSAGKMVLLAPDAEPKPDEVISIDGIEFSLAKVEVIKPAEVIMLYMLDISQ